MTCWELRKPGCVVWTIHTAALDQLPSQGMYLALSTYWAQQTQENDVSRLCLTGKETRARAGLSHFSKFWDSHGGLRHKETACDAGDPGSIPGLGRFPWRRKWLPTPLFLPGESHGQRGLMGYSP